MTTDRRSVTKSQNVSLVLRAIYHAPKISRADIARVTDLARPTVSTIVGDLIERQFVTEIGYGAARNVGKPPLMLEIDPTVWRILCLEIGSQEFRGALINLRGEITERITIPANDQTGNDALQLLFQLIEKLSIGSLDQLLGIGIGTPGLIDVQGGIVREAVNLKWHQLPLQQLIADRYSVPIYLANDSQAAALGEYTFGSRRAGENLLLIRMGRGIGAGIILNGELYHGDNSGAGEIGHVVLQNGDQYQTLEDIASTRALLSAASKIAGEPLSWDQFVEEVNAGNASYIELVDRAAFGLGITLSHLVSILNINNIVISGRFTQFGDGFRHKSLEVARQRLLHELIEGTSLSYSTLGTDIVLLGCAAFILKSELGII